MSDYLRQTRDANIWVRPPAMYPESEEYFRDHPWGELDPQVPHNLSSDPAIEVIPIEKLVPESRIYAGRIVATTGVIRGAPSRWWAMPTLPEWVVQIQSSNKDYRYLTVYCRVTTSAEVSLKRGDEVAVNGLVLAAGQVKQTDGPGTLDVAYMACSAIGVVPRGKTN